MVNSISLIKIILVFFFSGVFFFPPFDIPFIRGMSIGIEVFVVLLFCGFLFFIEPKKLRKDLESTFFLKLGHFYYPLLLIILFTVCGMLYYSLALSGRVIIRDFFTIALLFLYFPAIYLGYLASHFVKESFLLKVITFWGFLSLVVGFIMYFDIGNLNPYMIKIWDYSRAQLLVDQVPWRRFLGTFKNPNYYGALSIIFVVIFSRAAQKFKVVPMKVFLFVLGGMSILALLLTGSRTGTVSLLFVFAVFFLLYFLKGKISKKIFSTVILVGIAFFIISATNPFIFSRVYGFEDWGRFMHGIYARLFGIWAPLWEYIVASPVVGLGPIKDEVRFLADNNYVLILVQSGLLGLSSFLLFIFFFIRNGIVDFFVENNLLKLGVGLTFFIYCFTADFFYHHELIFLTLFLLGFYEGRFRYIKNPENNHIEKIRET